MSEIIFTGLGDPKADRITVDRARAYEDLSAVRKRTDRSGQPIRRIMERVYTGNLRDPVEEILRRNVWSVLGTLHPGMVISGRSAAVARTTPAPGDGAPHFVFLTGPYRRNLSYPGLEVRIAEGPGAMPGDVPYMGLYLASPERQCLENLAPSRDRRGVTRTTGPAAVEAFLDRTFQIHGADGLTALVERARAIRTEMGADAGFRHMRSLVGAMLGTGDASVLTTVGGRAIARAEVVDRDCAETLALYAGFLRSNPMPDRPDRGLGRVAATNTAFVEAFFSNYIEGVAFPPGEARELVFSGAFTRTRVEDASDLVATFEQLSAYEGMQGAPRDFDRFHDGLLDRHARLMAHRPDVRPGRIKERPNRAGNTVFAAPAAVRGTLRYGHELLQGLTHPFARASFVHFLVSSVHPFDDGNGRLSRIVMAEELTAGGQSRVVVPNVFGDEYISGQRALSRNRNPGANFRALDRCQAVTAAIVEDDLDACLARWATTHAFVEPSAFARLTVPTDETPGFRDGIPAPESYWAMLEQPVGDHAHLLGT